MRGGVRAERARAGHLQRILGELRRRRNSAAHQPTQPVAQQRAAARAGAARLQRAAEQPARHGLARAERRREPVRRPRFWEAAALHAGRRGRGADQPERARRPPRAQRPRGVLRRPQRLLHLRRGRGDGELQAQRGTSPARTSATPVQPHPHPHPPRAPAVVRHLPHEQVHAGAPRAGRAPQDPRRLPRARRRLARGVPRHPDVGGRLPLPAARPRRPQPVRPHRDRGDGADARGVRADAHAAQPAHLAARRQGGLLLRRVSAARPPRRRRRRARRRRRRRRRRAREAVAPGRGRGEGGGARQLHRRRRREVRRLRPPQHRRRVDDRARRDHRRRRRRPPPPAGAPLRGAVATHRAHHAPAHALLHPRRPAPPQRDVRATPAAAAPAATRAAAAADAAPPLAATRSRPTRTSTSTASSRGPCCRPAARSRSRI